jgi:hypothetical protein
MAAIYFCYDRFDRLVLTQDANTRAEKKWLFIKYDRKGRAVKKGLYTNTTAISRSSIQGIIDLAYSGESDIYYEDNADTNLSFPTSSTEDLVKNYYDNYARAYIPQNLTGEAAPENPSGLMTSSSQLVLGTTTWINAHYFYDINGRIVQVQANNHIQASINDVTTTVYDFEGKITLRKIYHDGAGYGTTTVLNKFEYDHMGRPLNVYQNNNNAPTDQLVAQYEYNAVGQLVDKKLHHTGGTNFLQSVDYRYSIQGWLTSINNSKLDSNPANNNDITDFFGMELLYNKQEAGLNTGTNETYYNGDVSVVKWKRPGDDATVLDQKSYKYAYDKSGRLTNSSSQMYDGIAWSKETGAFNENLSYDPNGNILTLSRNQRKHLLAGINASYIAETIDNLTYTYNTSLSDQLVKITDATAKVSGFDNGASATANDYEYEPAGSGNLTKDLNKGVSNITYNILGKPVLVTFTDSRKIEYIYDASGNKLTMKTYAPTGSSIPPQKTDYVNNFVYENGNLSFFSSPEGRVFNNAGVLEYQYAIADHLGNTRVLFTSNPVKIGVTATNFEAGTNGTILNYENRSGLEAFDHTDAATLNHYSQLLNGGYNSQVGVAKTYKVYPGDKVKAEAYVKYWNAKSDRTNLADFGTMLASAFGVSAASTGEALAVYNNLDSYGNFVEAGTAHGSNAGDPKGFITIMLYDKNHNFLNAAWDQLDDAYVQGSDLNVKSAFDNLVMEVTVKEEGFAFVYLSNESPTFVDIYFDDIKFTYTPTRVIQYNEYYPFGLQANTSWTRENSKNDFLFNQGSELNKTTGWYETFFRNYDPSYWKVYQYRSVGYQIRFL